MRSASKAGRFRMRVLAAIMRRLRWIGIRMEIFLTVREGETLVEVAQPNAFSFAFLTVADVDDLVRLEPGTDRQKLIDWFQQGKLCYGIRDQSRLIAKMWCDLDEFNYPPNYRRLGSDEVYLYAAFADPEYRGHSLAPMMRAKGYEALRELGRNKFYSYTDFFNTAARRFKAKLGARNEALRIYLELFGKWSKTFTVRRWPRLPSR